MCPLAMHEMFNRTKSLCLLYVIQQYKVQDINKKKMNHVFSFGAVNLEN